MTEQGTRTQEAILRTMIDHERRTGLPATVREIAQEARIGADMSTGLVCYHLKRLVAAGAVTHQPGGNRTYRAVRGTVPCATGVEWPAGAGGVPAGPSSIPHEGSRDAVEGPYLLARTGFTPSPAMRRAVRELGESRGE